MTDAAVAADPGPATISVTGGTGGGAPINENPASHTNPLGSQIPPGAEAKPAPPAKPATLDDSIDRAIAKSAAKQAEPKEPAKVEAKEPAKDAPARGEGGKFAAKEPAIPAADARAADQQPPKAAEPVKPSHTAEDAPSRFTETAKAKWHTADPEIRGETLRMHKELTDGLQKYKQAAERDGTLNEFHEMAKASNKELPNVVREYVNMENKLRTDLVGGLDDICQRVGVSLKDVAAHVLNQTPDQNASKQDATIRDLRQQNSTLEARLNKLEGGFQQQQEQSTLTEINKFAADHPRFDELANDIAFFMQSGRAQDLPEAYTLAERLNPAAGKASEPVASSAAPLIEPPVQPDKGQKSINGAPSSGLTSSRKKGGAVPSIDESLDRAFHRTG